MAEDILLSQCDFPGGTFHAIVPWSTTLQGEEQEVFIEAIRREKNKQANIFPLARLGSSHPLPPYHTRRSKRAEWGIL